MVKGIYEHNPGMDYVVTKFTREVGEQKFNPARLDIHHVRMPAYNEKGWYPQGLSIDGFRHRMQKRHIKSMKGADGNWSARPFAVSFWYRCELRIDYDERRKIEDRFFKEEPASVTEHATLWDFYEAIGYDHKKNKLAVEPVRL